MNKKQQQQQQQTVAADSEVIPDFSRISIDLDFVEENVDGKTVDRIKVR